MLYASRVKKNPLSSIVYESDLKVKHKFQNFDTEKEFSTQDKLIIAGFIVGLGIMIWGIISKGWYMVEISALFLGLGLLLGASLDFLKRKLLKLLSKAVQISPMLL